MRGFLILVNLCSLGIATASASEVVLTVDSAIEMALRRNPDLLAARTIIAEAEGRARSTGRLSNPEIGLEIAGGRDFEGRVEVGVSQRFPLTARLRLERRLSAVNLEQARLEVQEKERQLALAAQTAFYELAAARQATLLAEQQTSVAKDLAGSLQGSAKEGLASVLDAGLAGLIGEEFEAGKETSLAEEAIASGRLASLLGLSADASLTIKETLALPKALPPNRSLGYRADLRLAESAVVAGAVDVSLARAARWDDVGLGLFVEGERLKDEPEGIESEAVLGVRLSVPIPLWQNGRGKVAEKQAIHDRQQRELEALRLSALNQALVAYRVMAVHFRAASKIETQVLTAARKQVADSDASYQRGEIDLQILSRARERLAQIEVSALEARKKFFLSRSEWLAAVGDVSKP